MGHELLTSIHHRVPQRCSSYTQIVIWLVVLSMIHPSLDYRFEVIDWNWALYSSYTRSTAGKELAGTSEAVAGDMSSRGQSPQVI